MNAAPAHIGLAKTRLASTETNLEVRMKNLHSVTGSDPQYPTKPARTGSQPAPLMRPDRLAAAETP